MDGRANHRVLVTGGAGFLGSHLCDRLIAEGHHVVCLDNFSTGARRNVVHLTDHDRFELLEHDITAPLQLDADQVYNLACPASPRHYQRDPIETMRINVIGSLNMLDLAVRNGAAILQASTSEVYGDPDVHPQIEDYCGNVNPIGPRACYDEGKRSAETLFFDYRRTHALAIKVARIFNTYGPRMDPADGRVVSNFIVQALQGHDITLNGDGSQTRSFCYVDDMVEGLTAFMAAAPDMPGPLNFGDPVTFTMRELAEQIIALTGSRSAIVHRPLPQDDPRQRCPDITRARDQLGWAPRTALRDGLTQTIAYFDRLLSNQDA